MRFEGDDHRLFLFNCQRQVFRRDWEAAVSIIVLEMYIQQAIKGREQTHVNEAMKTGASLEEMERRDVEGAI